MISVHILCLDDCFATTTMPQLTEITQFIFGQPLSSWPVLGLVTANRRMTTRRTLLLLAAVVAVNSFAFSARGQLQRFATSELTIVSATGPHRFRVEVAETPAQMEQGLMFRRTLAPDAGMLFDYKAPTV